MIHKKKDIINEIIHRRRLRKEARGSFRAFLQYMIPEFFTDYKFSKYMGRLADRCEALVKKQRLVRSVREILHDIYMKQLEMARLAMDGGIDSELYSLLMSHWLIKLDIQRDVLYKRLRKLSMLDDRVFIKPKDNTLNSLMMKANYVCDRARLKLTISLPPGAGKTLISSLLSVWVIGDADNYIHGSVMRNSYSAEMAETMSYSVREFVNNPRYSYIYPHVKLQTGRKSVKGWGVEGATELTYFGSGPGGSVSGKRAKTLAIYDDFCKGMKEALSPAEINETWLFYNSVHIKRMISGTAELIIGTRYVKGDLIGRVLDKQSQLWETLKVPALETHINDEGEEVERSFCEEIHTTQEYLYEREITDPVIWNAVSQQEPVSDEGLLFPETELQTFSLDELHDINYKVGFCDTADEGIDHLAAIVLAARKPHYREYEWERLVGKYDIIKDWDESWYDMWENNEVFVKLDSLPTNDVRIPPDLMQLLISKFRMSMNFYLVDVVFSQKGVDYTIPDVVNLIIKHNPNEFTFESNKEGKSYAREIEHLIAKKCYTLVKTENQHSNKETRIMNAAPRIKKYIFFRNDYKKGSDYAKFMEQLTEMIRLQKNQPDDSGDVLSLAADIIFELSGRFFDVLSTAEDKPAPKVSTQFGDMDERKYRIYDRLRNKKNVEVLRLDYMEKMRTYMVSLLDTFAGDEHLVDFTVEQIHTLDEKFYGKRKEISLNGIKY